MEMSDFFRADTALAFTSCSRRTKGIPSPPLIPSQVGSLIPPGMRSSRGDGAMREAKQTACATFARRGDGGGIGGGRRDRE